MAFLLEQNDLTQADLEDEIGARPYVSDILRGKKRLTSEQIRKIPRFSGWLAAKNLAH